MKRGSILFGLWSAVAAMCGCSLNTQPGTSATTVGEAGGRLAELSGKPLRPYATTDFGREKNPQARSVIVADEQEAIDLVYELREQVGPEILVYVGCTRSLADPPDEGFEVVVALGQDQFDILRVAESDAVNYDMETEDLVRKLNQYDARYGIDIFHAETDTIEFQLGTKPGDMPEFCADLYEFCPDIVDQGVGSVEELEKYFDQTDVVFLWWD